MGKGKLSIRIVKSKMKQKVVSGKKTYRSFQSQYNHDFRFETMDSTYLKRPNELNKAMRFNGMNNVFDIKNRGDNFKSVEKQWKDIQKQYKDFHKKGLHSETKPVLNFLLSFEEDFDLSLEDRSAQIKSVQNFIKENYDYPIYLVQHNDEKSLHYSFSILNYDNKTNRPLAKQINTSDLQDKIANHLKNDNMDFGHTRGNPKSISLSKHRTIMEGKTLALENEIANLKNEKDKIILEKDDLKAEVVSLRKEKVDLEEMFLNAKIYQEEIQNEIVFIINAFTNAGLNYKGKTNLSLIKLAGKYLNFNDMNKLQTLLGKLDKLTKKEIKKTTQP